MLGGMLTKDRKPPDGFSDWDSFYEHGAREILPKLERAPSHVRDVVNTTMAAAAKLKHGYRVLEPSAGAGALVTAAMNIAAVDVDAYDINPGVQDRLSAIGVGQAALTGGSLSVRIQDFLLAEPNPIYDAVLMNPPFQGGQDMAHVTHAWRFLMSGGVLVAIMGSGPSGFRDATTKAAVAFRALVASAKSSEVTEIPGGTFEDTGVATVMLVMRKA